MIEILLPVLLVIIIAWYVGAKRNPEKFAPFLAPPYGKKRGIICIVLLLALGLINTATYQPETKSAAETVQQAAEKAEKAANPDKATDNHKAAIAAITKGTKADTASAEAILTALQKVGIRDYDITSVTSYDGGKHDSNTEKVFIAGRSTTNVFLYLEPGTNKVIAIRANGKDLYKDGKPLMTYDNSFKD